MVFPFIVIESTSTSRNEFYMTDGYQPTHALFYLKKGAFEIEVDGVKQTVRKGDCYILPSYVYHRRNVIEPIEFVYIKFACNEACPYTIEVPHGKITFRDPERFHSIMHTLEEVLLVESSLCKGYREHLLLDILFQIHFDRNPQKAFSQPTQCHDNAVNAAIRFIGEHLNQKLSVEQICREVGTNPSTLNFKFQREFTCSIGQYIMAERIKKAKKLLVSTSYRIGEIATRCGFENVYYFSNCFKKSQGVTPTEYRNAAK